MTDNEPDYGASHVLTLIPAPPQPSLLGDSSGWLVLGRCQADGCRWKFPAESLAPFDSEDQAREAATTAGEKHRAARAKAEKAEARAAARRGDLPGQTEWGFSS